MIRLPTRSFTASSVPLVTPIICSQCLHRIHVQRLAWARTARPPVPCRPLSTEATKREELAPLRKQLKEEAKRRRVEGAAKSLKNKPSSRDPRLEKWELTVGIEIHAELNTERKLFSTAVTSTSDDPNTHVALFDLAYPGSQPEFQKATLLPALRAALALNCSIQRRSSFDRKHYFYQDQPAGYQITQYYEPFARDGHIVLHDHDGIAPEDGESVRIGIKQIQMEQDTAKTLQQPPSTYLLDFNRVSHPLIEIITLPHMHSPATAAACVKKIQAVLKSVDAVTAGMEVGGMRADVNVSVRRRDAPGNANSQSSYHGVTGLGQRTEIKNISSIKAVEDAIIAERDRQIAVLEAGGVIESETRGWTLGSSETTSLRSKEGEVDYRYMPDPDLGPVLIGDDVVTHLKETLPLLPDEALDMLVSKSEYGLTVKDAKTLISLDDGDRLDYYLDVVSMLRAEFEDDAELLAKTGKFAGNWVLHELGGLLTASNVPWSPSLVPSTHLSSIIAHLLRRQITGPTAKRLLSTIFFFTFSSGPDPPLPPHPVDIIRQENLLLRPLSDAEYAALARRIVGENEKMAAQVRELRTKGAKGWEGKVMWFVGQMVRSGEEGRVEAERAGRAVRRVLFGEQEA